MFPSEEDRRDELATERAADLLEHMLDHLSGPDHDWIMISHEAAELARLATRIATRAGHPNPAETSTEDD